MKRSDINPFLKRAKSFMQECGFHLPPFAFWTPEDWAVKGGECDEIRQCGLGWDVTDFGTGDFRNTGLLLFTLRNGIPDEFASRGKTYAEKIMIVEEGQVTPTHFHWVKHEDIINRAGGELVLRLHASDEMEMTTDDPIEVQVDGITQWVGPGGEVRLKPGESIMLPPRLYHAFWAEGGRCLVGEVSSVNDDRRDNRFLDAQPRFSDIEEDEPPLHLLCNEYP